jgi:hypothetical protein
MGLFQRFGSHGQTYGHQRWFVIIVFDKVKTPSKTDGVFFDEKQS